MRSECFVKPKFLAPLDESITNDDFSTLTGRETIRSIVKKMNNILGHPVTIYDINRFGVATSGVRFGSDTEHYSIHNRGPCQIFRICAGASMCLQCDDFHMPIFKDFTRSMPLNVLEERISLLLKNKPSFFSDGYMKYQPVVRQLSDRLFVEYNCPILGFRELLFPIFFRNAVIGVLILGQIKNVESKEIMEDIASGFFAKLENQPELIFSNLLQNNTLPVESPEEIKDIILGIIKHSDAKEFDVHLSSGLSIKEVLPRTKIASFVYDKQYDNLIEIACDELKTMELFLEDKFREKRSLYFESVLRESIKSFFLYMNQHTGIYNQASRGEELYLLWDNFHQALIMVKEKLEINEVLIFADGVNIEFAETKIKRLYPCMKMNSPQSDWHYDFTKTEGIVLTEYGFINSIDYPEILNGLHFNCEKENVILIVYPDIAILLIVEDITNNRDLYIEISNAIGRNLSPIRSLIALCAANYLKEHHIRSMQTNRHESKHITTLLEDNLKRYFSNDGEFFMRLSSEKRKLVINDIKNAVRSISNMSESIGVITGAKNVKTVKNEKVDVFYFFNQYKNLFGEKLRDRNLDLEVLRGTNRRNRPFFIDANAEAGPRYIFTDPKLFELLVYNLIDNAVKYAYRGSRIYLVWVSSWVGSGFQLSISNFGPQIENSKDIYSLYYRGYKMRSIEGDGIGLYVAKRSSELLNMDVSDSCTVIDKYNIPLMEWYIGESFDSSHIQVELEQHIMQLKKTGYYYDIVNSKTQTRIERKRDLSKEYICKNIQESTWLTTFTINFYETEAIF